MGESLNKGTPGQVGREISRRMVDMSTVALDYTSAVTAAAQTAKRVQLGAFAGVGISPGTMIARRPWKGIRIDLKSGGRNGAQIRAVSPVHLVDLPTIDHPIKVKKKKALAGNLRHPILERQGGVHHPGTDGKGAFVRAKPVAYKAAAQAHHLDRTKSLGTAFMGRGAKGIKIGRPAGHPTDRWTS